MLLTLLCSVALGQQRAAAAAVVTTASCQQRHLERATCFAPLSCPDFCKVRKEPIHHASHIFQRLTSTRQQHRVSGTCVHRSSTLLGGTQQDNDEAYAQIRSDVPLVFLPGIKGSHLASELCSDEEDPLFEVLQPMREQWSYFTPRNVRSRRKRAWLTLSGLLNFPPKPDDDAKRNLALPLTYTDGVQDRGGLFADGVVEHIVENDDFGLEYFPFYGHVTQLLDEINGRYWANGGKEQTGESRGSSSLREGGNSPDLPLAFNSRPTATFAYDWRRSLAELSDEFHSFTEAKFPGQPVQVLAHSLGGLLAFGAIRQNPEKYTGAVLVGVPFGTGIQYLQDMHKGYFTELDRCRQFLPPAQFTFASHWSFFPMNDEELGDLFVEVPVTFAPFQPDKSSIGKKVASSLRLDPVYGERIDIDFYNPDNWEKHELGIFDPSYRQNLDDNTIEMYKKHMQTQLDAAKLWRNTVLCEGDEGEDLPPLVACATNSVPTVNQILRRKRTKTLPPDVDGDRSPQCQYEYDYVSGRSVPGDGRIDYVKAFPPQRVPFKAIPLDSLHAKQMCWKEQGGSLETIWSEVNQMLRAYQAQSPKVALTVNDDMSPPELLSRRERRRKSFAYQDDASTERNVHQTQERIQAKTVSSNSSRSGRTLVWSSIRSWTSRRITKKKRRGKHKQEVRPTNDDGRAKQKS